MNFHDAGTHERQSPVTEIQEATRKLESEVRRLGLPSSDREPQMLCRLAFSVCPERSVCRQAVRQHGWIKSMDETWVCRHQGLRMPSARGKVTMAIMRDLQRRLDKLREAGTSALFAVKERRVQLQEVAPTPCII